ncbi:MAG: putative metal-binding motif-containing protein [Polyangiaceae bacterium]
MTSRAVLGALGAVCSLSIASSAAAQVVTVSDLSLARSVSLASDSYLGGLDVADDGTVFAFSNMGELIFRVGSDDSVNRITSGVIHYNQFRGDLRIGRDGLIHRVPTSELSFPVQRYSVDGTRQADLALIQAGTNLLGTSLDFDCRNDAFAAVRVATLYRITPSGVVSPVQSSYSFDHVDEVEAGLDNVMYLAEAPGGSDALMRLAPDGTVTSYAAISGANLRAAAVDFSNGDVYAATSTAVYRLRDGNGNQQIDDASEWEVVMTGSDFYDVGYGPSAAGGGYSLYVQTSDALHEIRGLVMPSGDCGPHIDDDGDGACELGLDANADGDCLDPGEATAAADCADDDPTRFPGATDACDGIDNDCDGSADEDFATLGDPCSAGIGACVGAGTLVCSVDQLGVACDAVAGAPQPEICGNGIDEDCDGADEPCGSGGTGGAGGAGGIGGVEDAGVAGTGGQPQYEGDGSTANPSHASKKIDDGDCNCRLQAPSGRRPWVWGLGALLLAGLSRRRRVRRRR